MQLRPGCCGRKDTEQALYTRATACIARTVWAGGAPRYSARAAHQPFP